MKIKAYLSLYQWEEVVQLPEHTPADDHEEVVHDGQVDHHQPVVVVVRPAVVKVVILVVLVVAVLVAVV